MNPVVHLEIRLLQAHSCEMNGWLGKIRRKPNERPSDPQYISINTQAQALRGFAGSGVVWHDAWQGYKRSPGLDKSPRITTLISSSYILVWNFAYWIPKL